MSIWSWTTTVTYKTAMVHDWLAHRPHFHVHFTPTSTSWLNQVERWFASLTEKQIRRGSHRSTRELEQAIKDYLAVYNEEPKESRQNKVDF